MRYEWVNVWREAISCATENDFDSNLCCVLAAKHAYTHYPFFRRPVFSRFCHVPSATFFLVASILQLKINQARGIMSQVQLERRRGLHVDHVDSTLLNSLLSGGAWRLALDEYHVARRVCHWTDQHSPHNYIDNDTTAENTIGRRSFCRHPRPELSSIWIPSSQVVPWPSWCVHCFIPGK